MSWKNSGIQQIIDVNSGIKTSQSHVEAGLVAADNKPVTNFFAFSSDSLYDKGLFLGV